MSLSQPINILIRASPITAATPVLPICHTVCTKKNQLALTPPPLSPHTVSWSPLGADITIHKACYSRYFIDSRADIKADGFSLNPLKTSDAE